MKRTIFVFLLLLFSSAAMSQVIGKVDKRTKEFFIPSNFKGEYRVFGYMYPRDNTPKMICFSSHDGDVRANSNNCPLGSYYDTGRMKIGDNISYAGMLGNFGKMIYVSSTGKKTVFYLPKSSFVIK
jgi:hypothetical protein